MSRGPLHYFSSLLSPCGPARCFIEFWALSLPAGDLFELDEVGASDLGI